MTSKLQPSQENTQIFPSIKFFLSGVIYSSLDPDTTRIRNTDWNINCIQDQIKNYPTVP